MIMKTALFVILGLAVILLAVYIYFGGFAKIELQIAETGGETLVFEEITGDYKQSAVVMDKIYHDLLEKEDIETYRGFGIYYDNPKEVEIDKLRADAGCILEDSLLKHIPELEGKYNIKTLPTSTYISTEFPFRGKLSVLLGILRVYPALQKFAKSNQLDNLGEVVEIYDIPNKKIIYRQLLKQQ
jgi:effector-binding domain-containing protein